MEITLESDTQNRFSTRLVDRLARNFRFVTKPYKTLPNGIKVYRGNELDADVVKFLTENATADCYKCHGTGVKDWRCHGMKARVCKCVLTATANKAEPMETYSQQVAAGELPLIATNAATEETVQGFIQK